MALQKLRSLWTVSGHVDALDRYHVVGWAARPGGRAPLLRIVVDGKTLDRIVPTNPRSDLAKLYGRRIRLGFDHIFDPPLPAGAEVSVTDRFGRHLTTSPRIVPQEPEFDPDSIGDGLSTPVPPAELVFLVIGHRDRAGFAAGRKPPVDYIIARLTQAGVDPSALRTILDFGCGCGRILAGWEHALTPSTRLIGCDINPRLIAFCQAHIPFATTFVSDYRPPLARIATGEIDFAYAASVFTHLTPDAVLSWAQEMARIIRPGGHLMLSFHGARYNDVVGCISDDGLDRLKKKGIYTHLHGEPGRSPLGSNNYATFMTQDHVTAVFADFEPIEIIAGSDNPFMGGHDIVMLRRRMS
jgi:SAM-dependent methyltransferase